MNDPVNIGNPHEMSIEDMARLIIRMTGSTSQVVFKPLPTDDPQGPPARHHARAHAARLGAEGVARRGLDVDDRVLQDRRWAVTVRVRPGSRLATPRPAARLPGGRYCGR